MIVFVLVCSLCDFHSSSGFQGCAEVWRLNYETMEDCQTAKYLLSKTGAAGLQNTLECVVERKT